MAESFDKIVRGLAGKYITNQVFGGNERNAIVRDCWLIRDGRTRKKFWRQLLEQGYLTDETKANPENQEAKLTDKAFVELPTVPVDLAGIYKFDTYEVRDGKPPYVEWDRLSVGQKKTVVLALKSNPLAYTLSAVADSWKPIKKMDFVLGGGGAAMEAIGGFQQDGKIVITDASLTDKHARCRREWYKTECMNSGLNWFLKEKGLATPAQAPSQGFVDVPVSEKQPGLGMVASLHRDPAKWEADLPVTIQATKDEIARAQQRLRALENLQCQVLLENGWPAFLAKYEAAIDAHVDAELAKE